MVAYFSMEVGIDAAMPTHAGGLGVLAGDVVRAAADLGLPLVAVTLLHRKGYFRQRLDAAGRQHEDPEVWQVDAHLERMAARVTLPINGHPVTVCAWRRRVTGLDGEVPVYFLDTDVEPNAAEDRALSHVLYGGDAAYRLAQEAVLGIGGVRMLRALGYDRIERFHLNEGHSALLALELVNEHLQRSGRSTATDDDIEAVRRLCVFTTHTPVAAAHDQFPLALADRVIGAHPMAALAHRCCYAGALNMTYLALTLSHYVNGVAMRHGELSRQMFGGHRIDAITNGVHAATWVSDPFRTLFDRQIPGWQADNFSLRYALGIPISEIWSAHTAAKRQLLALVNRTQTLPFDPGVLTIGFGRRATAYKRADLLVSDVARLRGIARSAGRVQIVYAGKAHPRDEEGKRAIGRVFQARAALGADVPIAYLENYDMAIARLLTAGADVWLNTPQPPLEASGTSGMKAALNGVPSLSVLDGWWIEGHIEGVTGWAIGGREGQTGSAIALNGSFFTAQRMLQEYAIKAYGPEALRAHPAASSRASEAVST